jgi:hypothetical protein
MTTDQNNYKNPLNGSLQPEYLEDRDGLILGLMVFFAILVTAGIGLLGWLVYQLLFNYEPPSS